MDQNNLRERAISYLKASHIKQKYLAEACNINETFFSKFIHAVAFLNEESEEALNKHLEERGF